MEAGRVLDALSLADGYEGTGCDAVAAFIQSYLRTKRKDGTTVITWLHLPRDRWPDHWHGKYRDPVVPLVLALYGHPDSGGYWEERCDECLKNVGFELIESWRSVYWHPKYKALLIVYVDDFKLACPKEHTQAIWAAIRKQIVTDEPKPPDRFLGCYAQEFQTEVRHLSRYLEQSPLYHPREGDAPAFAYNPNKRVRGYMYNMETYLADNVAKFRELTKDNPVTLKNAATPFIDEGRLKQGCVVAPDQGGASGSVHPVVGRDAGAPNASAEGGSPSESVPKELNRVAAKASMTTMYAARLARFDLLRCVGHLATYLTKWDSEQDDKLSRMMSYVNCSGHYRQIGFLGDPLDKVELGLFCDADFAGDRRDSKSTSGVFMALIGPNTFFPLSALSKKQSVCSHSTPEAEIVAAYTAVRTIGIPMLDLWEKILGRVPRMHLFEDNQATSTIIRSGKYPTLRHVHKMHGVSISWLHDAFVKEVFHLVDCHTDFQSGDIFTKHFTDMRRWRKGLDLIGVVHEKELLELLEKSRVGKKGEKKKVTFVVESSSSVLSAVARAAPAVAARPARPRGMRPSAGSSRKREPTSSSGTRRVFLRKSSPPRPCVRKRPAASVRPSSGLGVAGSPCGESAVSEVSDSEQLPRDRIRPVPWLPAKAMPGPRVPRDATPAAAPGSRPCDSGRCLRLRVSASAAPGASGASAPPGSDAGGSGGRPPEGPSGSEKRGCQPRWWGIS